MYNWTIQGRSHLEDGCFRCHYGYHSANLYGRTAVNSTRGKTEESLGVLGKKRKKLFIEHEEMVEVARVELANFISVYKGFKVLHVTMHVTCSAN